MSDGLSSILNEKIQLRPRQPIDLELIHSAAQRILKRWPDTLASNDSDAEAYLAVLRGRIDKRDWNDATLASVVRGARAAFNWAYRDRADVRPILEFCLKEVLSSDRRRFLDAMAAVYEASCDCEAWQSEELGKALATKTDLLGPRWQTVLSSIPDFFDCKSAHKTIALAMAASPDPFKHLIALGIRSPHGEGLMEDAHLAFLDEIEPMLDQQSAIDQLLTWMKPEGRPARSAGATEAIEAILSVWQDREPPDALKRHLVERLVTLYGDPRVTNGFPWGTVHEDDRATIFRWLTGEDIRFFLDVVSAVETSHMWAPRKKFWLDLHERRMIDQAWVALSKAGIMHARRMRPSDVDNKTLRFGQQTAGGGRADTSLLILKIGDCIIVEGSHSYRIQVFPANEAAAPKLFKSRYDCEDIRLTCLSLERAGQRAEQIQHSGRWQNRVRIAIDRYR